MYTPKTLEWFIQRIGNRIYRDYYECCPSCTKAAEDGLIIHNEDHARYLAELDSDYAVDGVQLNYRDNK